MENIEKQVEEYLLNKDNKHYISFEDFLLGVKWQLKRSYTLEQIDELFVGDKKGGYFDEFLDYKLGLNNNQGINKITFKEWFEQIKNK